jgi:hypothetical protein
MAMLPIVFSFSKGEMSAIQFNPQQQTELLLTIGQSFTGLVFLLNMEFAWWEALSVFLLFVAQFALPPFFGEASKNWIAAAFFLWGAVEIQLLLFRKRRLPALMSFRATWNEHVRT